MTHLDLVEVSTPASEPTSVQTSVVVVSYNCWSDLEKCLTSLERNLSEKSEVIVVDNDSRDGTPDAISERYPWVRLVRSSENVGFGGGSNLGAEQAQGSYLAFLNPDTTVEPGWLEALVSALESDSSAGLATSKILLMQEPERINTCGNEIHVSGLTLCRGTGEPRAAFSRVEEVGAVSGAAFVIRRELFEALGGFDPAFFMYMEDTDLSLRARLAGYRCLFVPDSIVYHRYQLHFGPRKTFYQERNRYLMLLKNFRWRTLLAMLPALLLAEVVTWGFVLLRERKNFGNKMRAYLWAVKHGGKIRAGYSVGKYDRAVVASCLTDLAYEQTGDSLWARLAHWVFDPLFWVFKKLATVWL